MRIIHGEHSGRRIHLPKRLRARPTTDQARESLFNILNNRYELDGYRVLDLFAGTGSISYEFASLGCKSIISIDKDSFHVASIKKNCDEIGLSAISVIRSDVFRFLASSGSKFDMIFADPPYDMKNLKDIPDIIIDSGCLATDGLLILEHGPSNNFNDHKALDETRKYGKVHFSFFLI